MECWLNDGVAREIAWPRAESSFRFGKFQILARPLTQEHEASLHIELNQHRMDNVGAISVLNQILSLATWVDDAWSILLSGWSRNPIPGSSSATD